MPDIFVDTAGWGHLVDKNQPYHLLAATIYRTARQKDQKLVTTNYIVAELVALLTSPLRIARPRLIGFITGIKTSPYVHIIHVDTTLDLQAWQLLTQRPDKAWSLVDCASFVIMQRERLTEALTTDQHFAQAGFVPLLR
ncbi:type II toxin-antitoxin system VapC family toxin [Candidatus Chloroploca sp. Khr17]|uniref:type II toxin-antitoxin system VapC family toxin n=1 Tax=Candidatus Chloroploca sp. Khr17 TaxID=2496869 RepID=UPI00101DE628|nr:PIN domain-containing protein [Candidatus Chloroploca sp. Khr17]